MAELTSSNNVIKTLPENVLHNLLYFLRMNEGFAKHVQTVAKVLAKISPSPQSLAPLLTQEGDSSYAVNIKQ
jgi:hypothetical protein